MLNTEITAPCGVHMDKYRFDLVAISPFHYGDYEMVKSGDKYIYPGNSIAGALRQYLENYHSFQLQKDTLLGYFGGVDSSSTFIESKLFISDGELIIDKEYESNLPKYEGTSIEGSTGTALAHHKYERNYFPMGTVLRFSITCDLMNGKAYAKYKHKQNQLNELDTLRKLIQLCANGIQEGACCFGGEKSNGFGVFHVQDVYKMDYSFNSIEDIDSYVKLESFYNFETDQQVDKKYSVKNEILASPTHVNSGIELEMKGAFPYGIYQAYKDDERVYHEGGQTSELTGVQYRTTHKGEKIHYIPATSIKGVFRHQVTLLIKRMLLSENYNDNATDEQSKQQLEEKLNQKVNEKVNEIFGSTDLQGKLIFYEVELKDAEPIEVLRAKQNSKSKEEPSTTPAYIKIDRLTGGVIDGAIKYQREMYSDDVNIKVKVKIDQLNQKSHLQYVFPLIYVMQQVGLGKLPLGGRTAIGLGQFSASELKIADSEHVQPTPVALDKLVESEEIREYYNLFEGWLKK